MPVKRPDARKRVIAVSIATQRKKIGPFRSEAYKRTLVRSVKKKIHTIVTVDEVEKRIYGSIKLITKSKNSKGFMYFSESNPIRGKRNIKIDNVEINPLYWRQGIMAQMMTEVIALVKRKIGKGIITLSVSLNNTPALEGYKKLGFVEVYVHESVFFGAPKIMDMELEV